MDVVAWVVRDGRDGQARARTASRAASLANEGERKTRSIFSISPSRRARVPPGRVAVSKKVERSYLAELGGARGGGHREGGGGSDAGDLVDYDARGLGDPSQLRRAFETGERGSDAGSAGSELMLVFAAPKRRPKDSGPAPLEIWALAVTFTALGAVVRLPATLPPRTACLAPRARGVVTEAMGT